MPDQHDLISAFARQWGVAEEAVVALLDQRRDVLTQFMAQWSVPPEALEELLTQIRTVWAGRSSDEGETAFFGFDDGPGTASDSGAVTLDTGVWGDPDDTMAWAPPESLPGPTLPGEDDGTEERSRTEGQLGRYEDLGLLGMGGMGEVRRVRDNRLRRTMAMKIVHRDLMGRQRLLSRFVEEAQVQAQLQHPNIVPIYEIAQLPDGRHYFTMKQIRGREFSESIRAVHQASPEDRWRPAEDGTHFRDLIRIHQQVCETVAYAHSQGVIHRDLKPENIMIGGFGEVLVVDWGLAKVLGREEVEWDDETEEVVQTDRSRSDAMQTRMGSVAGTPCYMAPEQAFGRTEEVGTATDVYTLGAILYEILSGQAPYRGDSAQEVLEKVKHSLPSVLRETDLHSTEDRTTPNGRVSDQRLQQAAPLPSTAKIPERLAEICEQAMAREIGDRTASARALAGELKAWLEGAEKREMGLEQVTAAGQMAEQARAIERKAGECWQEANALLNRAGVSSVDGWRLWSEHRSAVAEARQLWRQHGRRLQGALVYAPELEEAHAALAELRLNELLEAAAVGDRPAQEALRQQWNAHVQMLPATARGALEERLNAGLGDAIAGQRLRRGALVGRHGQREAVAVQIEGGAKLLTLLGTAGVGKTRLVLELAEDLRGGFSRTVFCDLTEATDAMDVALRLSRALDVRLRDTDPLGHLAEVLAAESTLLVLDNLEQMTQVIGPLVSEWVGQAEGLQVLATSRVRLGVEAETVVPIQPLSLLEGVDLFLRRAQAVDRRFDLSADNRALMCGLVQQLDGLPLAIELAAARLNIFTLDELAERLNERFSLLRSRGRDAQALDGALDWSWGLLQPWAKAALSQASLFRGGFTLAAAEGVIEVGADKKAPAMFDILGELVDNSLLRKDQSDQGGVRYSLLESIRAYAHEKLGDAGEMGSELRGPAARIRAQHRHAAHFSQLGTGASLQALDSFDSGERWVALFSELDNLVEAIGHGPADSASLCCLAALKVLGMKGPVSLGVDLATHVLGMDGVGKREQMLLEIERSKCLRISGRMQEAREMVTGSTHPPTPEADTEANEATTAPVVALEADTETPIESVTESVESDSSIPISAEGPSAQHPDLVEAERLLELGAIEKGESRYAAARKCYEAALEIFRTQANRKGEGQVLGNLGDVYYTQGQYDAAIVHYTKALAIAREIGNKRSEGRNLGRLGNICRVQDQYDEAIAHYTETIAIAREIGNKRFEGIYLGNLGILYKAQGESDKAITHYTQAIAIVREIGDRCAEGIHLGNLGDALVQLERLDEAEAAFREAIAIGERTSPVATGAFRGSLSLLLAQQGQMDEAQTLLETGEPQVESYPEEHAKFLCKKGQVCHLAGDADGARAALVQAQGIAAELKVKDDSEVGQAVAELAALVGESDPDGGGGGPSGRGSSERRTEEVSAEERDLALIEAERLMELGRIELQQSRYTQARECCEAALEIFRMQANRKGEGHALGILGSVNRGQGHYRVAVAHFTQALAIAREIGDKDSESSTLGSLGLVCKNQGEYDQAIIHYTQSLAIAREIGDKRGESIHVGNLGILYQVQGEYDQAFAHFTQSLAIAREIGDKPGQGVHLGSLGLVYQAQGQHDEAIAHTTQALAIAREVGDKRSEGILLGNLGDALVQLERLDEAEAAFRDAIPIGDETIPVAAGAFRGSLSLLLATQGKLDEVQALLEAGEPQVESEPEEYAKFLCKKGRVCHLAGDVEGARAALVQAQGMAAEMKVTDDSEVGQAVAELAALLGEIDPAGGGGPSGDVSDEERELALIEAERLLELGRIGQEEARYAEAQKCHRDALEIFRTHGDRTGEGRALGDLGLVYQAQGQYDQAINHFTQSLAIARDLGDKRHEGIHLGNLGNVYQEQGQNDYSITHYTQSLGIAREVGDKRREGINLGNLGLVYQVQGQYDQAIAHYTQALVISREIGDKRGEGSHLGNLGSVYLARDQCEQANTHFTQAIDIAREISHKRSEGIHLGNLGDVLVKLGRLDEAETAFRESIAIGDETFPVAGGVFRASLALLLAQGKQHDEALALLETGERQIKGYPEEHAKFLCKKGRVCHLAGDADGARAALVQAQGIVAKLNVSVDSELGQAVAELAALLGERDLDGGGGGSAGDVSDEERELALIEAVRLKELGNLEEQQSRYDEALKCYEAALNIFRAHADRTGEGKILGNIGLVYRARDQYEQAIAYHTQALAIAQEIGDKRIEGSHLGNLGIVYQAQGKYDKAIAHFTQSIAIAREIGIKRTEGMQLGNLGLVLKALGQHGRALAHHNQSLAIVREIGDKRLEASQLGNIGNVHQAQGNYEQAVKHHEQSIAIAREIGIQRTEGIQLGNLGDALFRLNQFDSAKSAYRTAISIGDEVFHAIAGATRGSLSLLLAKQGQLDEARTLLEAGEPQIESRPEEYAKFLCKKGQVCHIAGDTEGAKVALVQAGRIAAKLKVSDDSELGQALAELAALLGDSDPDGGGGPSGGVSAEERELALIEAKRLLELGRIELEQSRYAQARECCEASLVIFRAQANRKGEGHALGSLGSVNLRQGHYGVAVAHFTQALAIAREIGDKRFEGSHLGNLGTLYQEQGQSDEAITYYTQSIVIAREIGNKSSEGYSFCNLGNVYVSQGQYDEAISHFTQSLAIAREIGDKLGERISLGSLGIVYQAQGQYDEAVNYYNQSLAIARETGNKRSEGIHLGNLGDALVQLNQLDEAEGAFRKAIPIGDETFPVAAGAFRGSLSLLLAQQGQMNEAQTLLETGEPQVENYPEEHAKFLCKKGQVCHLAGDAEGARAALVQAQGLAAELKVRDDSELGRALAALVTLLGDSDPDGGGGGPSGDGSLEAPTQDVSDEERELVLLEAEQLMELGAIEREEGRYAKALKCYEAALEIFRTHESRTCEGRALGNLGNTYQILGQLEPAIAHFTQSIAIAREIGDKRHEGIHLGNLGLVYRAQGQLEPAIAHFTEALAIAREIGDKRCEGIHLGNLGLIYQAQGQHGRAIAHYTQSIAIAREIGDKRGEGIRLGNLGIVYRAQGQLEPAIAHHTEAIAIAREIGDKRHEGIQLGNLGDALVQFDRLDEAKTAFRKAIPIGDEIIPAAAGAFRGSLALLLALQGKHVEAQPLLEAGEPQVENYPEEHTKFLCKKGQVCHLAGDVEGARAALVQAQGMAAELKVTDDSEVGQAVAKLAALLGEGDPDGDGGGPSGDESGEERELALIEAKRLMELGNIEFGEGRHADARKCFEAALEIFRTQALRKGEGQALGNLGLVYRYQGQYDKTITHYTQALAIALEIGDKRGEGIHLGRLGNFYTNQGQYDDAIAHYTEALAIAREIGDKRSEGIQLASLANICKLQGQYDEAISHFTQSIAIAREIGGKHGEGIYLGNLGLVYKAKGQLEPAIEHYTQSIAIAREIGNKRNEGIHLGNLGDALVQLERLDEAEAAFREAIPIADETILAAAGAFRGSLALLLATQGKLDEAQALLEAGEPQVESEPEEHAKFLCKKGQVCHIAGDAEGARKALVQAQGIVAKLNVSGDSDVGQALAALTALLGEFDPDGGGGPSRDASSETRTEEVLDEERELALIEAERLLELGRIEFAESRYAEALKCFETALEIFRKHANGKGEAEVLGNLGNVYQSQGHYNEAIAHYSQALAIAREIGNKSFEGRNLGNLGVVFQSQGQYDEAIAHYNQSLAIAREIGNKRSEGIQIGHLSNLYQFQGHYDQAIAHYTEALAIARDIGNKSSECINLGNLGDVLIKLDRLDEAETAFREAIVIGDETFPVVGGIFRASLALLLAHKGQHDEAQTLLEAGEPQVENYPEEHAKFLCKKGQVCFLTGDAEGAEVALKQAKEMAAKLKVRDDSELGQALAALAVLLEGGVPDGGRDEPGGER